jgi:hypothetical protein
LRRIWIADDSAHLVVELALLMGLSEHLARVEAVGLGELPRRLPGSLVVEDPLHRV